MRLVHLGLGNFFRAHQAWYTDQAPDAAGWGYAAYSGRSAGLASRLQAQGGRYTLITRAAEGDRFDQVSAIVRAHSAADHEAWLADLADPQVRALTLTVTEAGYRRGGNGGLDRSDPQVSADIEALRRDPRAPVGSAPARIVAGLAARRIADAGPLAVVPCDNLPDNAAAARGVVLELAERVDPALAGWIAESVGWVTTMVDRITPRTTDDDLASVLAVTGWADQAPVVTEPFSEWVLSGPFPGGRPRWPDAGATFTDDVTLYEQRKLWLLNGAHSLLAYTGSARGQATVAEALADPTSRGWLETWWSEASPWLSLPPADVAAYRTALLERFGNPRMRHRLEQIAADGSQKLPVRILPALRLERAAGRIPLGAARVLGAWTVHLRGNGFAVQDAGAAGLVPLVQGGLSDAVRAVLRFLDPALDDDQELRAAVLDAAAALDRGAGD